MSRVQRTGVGSSLGTVDRLSPTSTMSSGNSLFIIADGQGIQGGFKCLIALSPINRPFLNVLQSVIRSEGHLCRSSDVSYGVTHTTSDPYRTAAMHSTWNDSRS